MTAGTRRRARWTASRLPQDHVPAEKRAATTSAQPHLIHSHQHVSFQQLTVRRESARLELLSLLWAQCPTEGNALPVDLSCGSRKTPIAPAATLCTAQDDSHANGM